MTARMLNRASFIAAFAAAALALFAPAAHAARNANAESYVQSSASAALQALGDTATSQQTRQQTFFRLMEQFADMPRIANYVLGRYGLQLRNDAALRAEWNSAFQDYAIAVYETQLSAYGQSTLRVTGSVERTAGQDVIVQSEMTPRGASTPTRVQWRVLRSGEVWKVVDVSLVIEGNEIWLAQQQQRDFLAALDRSGGDVRALIADVRRVTATMRQRILAGN